MLASGVAAFMIAAQSHGLFPSVSAFQTGGHQDNNQCFDGNVLPENCQMEIREKALDGTALSEKCKKAVLDLAPPAVEGPQNDAQLVLKVCALSEVQFQVILEPPASSSLTQMSDENLRRARLVTGILYSGPLVSICLLLGPLTAIDIAATATALAIRVRSNRQGNPQGH